MKTNLNIRIEKKLITKNTVRAPNELLPRITIILDRSIAIYSSDMPLTLLINTSLKKNPSVLWNRHIEKSE